MEIDFEYCFSSEFILFHRLRIFWYFLNKNKRDSLKTWRSHIWSVHLVLTSECDPNSLDGWLWIHIWRSHGWTCQFFCVLYSPSNYPRHVYKTHNGLHPSLTKAKLSKTCSQCATFHTVTESISSLPPEGILAFVSTKNGQRTVSRVFLGKLLRWIITQTAH